MEQFITIQLLKMQPKLNASAESSGKRGK